MTTTMSANPPSDDDLFTGKEFISAMHRTPEEVAVMPCGIIEPERRARWTRKQAVEWSRSSQRINREWNRRMTRGATGVIEAMRKDHMRDRWQSGPAPAAMLAEWLGVDIETVDLHWPAAIDTPRGELRDDQKAEFVEWIGHAYPEALAPYWSILDAETEGGAE